MANTLCKAERLNSKILIEKMFAGGSKSFSIFPLRVVYMPVENQDVQASILLSVSKKRFKRAVKRNRVKRQLREAYRMHKHQLLQILTDKQQQLAIAFIYLSDELTSSVKIAEIIPNEPDTVSTVEGNFLSIFYYSFILLSLSVSIISKFRV